ncbi:OB-fold nucleic acid binding domain-containing protein [Pseudactinotalea terrae]|uniref:OB-fold nucleic acid binding domain-containing protein n=1 Tax=Pseudactinotalea terrae TaxID=1743262 RepID=UPI0012E2BA15|nr:OB-fold nucleic acid binding domain-containing protein [Pseudactinotalea terrae]
MSRALKERLRRVFASTGELEADDELVEAALRGTDPVSRCRARERHSLSGVLRSVRYAARDARPELVAELYDGSGSVDLVWLGRREIAGIEPGRRLLVTGRLSEGDQHLVMYNPTYTLLAPTVAS